MAFRARKVLGTFEKRAPGPPTSRLSHPCALNKIKVTIRVIITKTHESVPLYCCKYSFLLGFLAASLCTVILSLCLLIARRIEILMILTMIIGIITKAIKTKEEYSLFHFFTTSVGCECVQMFLIEAMQTGVTQTVYDPKHPSRFLLQFSSVFSCEWLCKTEESFRF